MPAMGAGSRASPRDVVWREARRLREAFAEEDLRVARHVRRVQRAMRAQRLGTHHITATSLGYGADDVGREAVDAIFAEVLGADAACVRANFVSGTHAIACGLFGALRPGHTLMAAAGPPYDTLRDVIGAPGATGKHIAVGSGSLADWGVDYCHVDLDDSGRLDWTHLEREVHARQPDVVLVQRSCGYAFRPSLTLEEIGGVVSLCRASAPGCAVLVDNCYGEFVEEAEPCCADIGADLVMGSLIKGVGGTLAARGGYVAGRADLVSAAVGRLTVPGGGGAPGASGGDVHRLTLQGLHMAPHTVGEALKASRLIAAVMHAEGFAVLPGPSSKRRDFVTAVQLGSRDRLVAFCEAVQGCSPVGAYIAPVPGATGGYADEVVFADGTFVQGSTGEMTCDGPLREPYTVFCQGGTHWTQWAIALEAVVERLRNTP